MFTDGMAEVKGVVRECWGVAAYSPAPCESPSSRVG